jgi:hypothetical protein
MVYSKILSLSVRLVEAVCFTNPSVRLHIVITHKSTVLILSTVKTSDLTNVSVLFIL